MFTTPGSREYDCTFEQFTGKERDAETGLDYFGARYYSGAQGRFASPDPKHFSQRTLINPQKWNQYTYVINNPLVRFDPDGKDDHHIVVKAVFDKLKSSLLPEVYKSFDSATIYAGNQGMHHFWREHREYNALVKSLWDGFFDGIEPEKITKDMASDFISGLKQNPRIQKLNAQILIKGGVSPSAFPGWIPATTIDDAALLASRSWAKYLKTMGLFLSVGAFILTEPREAGADDTFKDSEARRKAEEEARQLQEFLQNTQGIGESDREYEARRQCLMGASAACH